MVDDRWLQIVASPQVYGEAADHDGFNTVVLAMFVRRYDLHGAALLGAGKRLEVLQRLLLWLVLVDKFHKFLLSLFAFLLAHVLSNRQPQLRKNRLQ